MHRPADRSHGRSKVMVPGSNGATAWRDIPHRRKRSPVVTSMVKSHVVRPVTEPGCTSTLQLNSCMLAFALGTLHRDPEVTPNGSDDEAPSQFRLMKNSLGSGTAVTSNCSLPSSTVSPRERIERKSCDVVTTLEPVVICTVPGSLVQTNILNAHSPLALTRRLGTVTSICVAVNGWATRNTSDRTRIMSPILKSLRKSRVASNVFDPFVVSMQQPTGVTPPSHGRTFLHARSWPYVRNGYGRLSVSVTSSRGSTTVNSSLWMRIVSPVWM